MRIDFSDGTFGDVVAGNGGDFTVASKGDVTTSGPIVAIARDDDGRESRRTVQYDDRVNGGGSGAPTVVLHTDGTNGCVTVSGKDGPRYDQGGLPRRHHQGGGGGPGRHLPRHVRPRHDGGRHNGVRYRCQRGNVGV